MFRWDDSILQKPERKQKHFGGKTWETTAYNSDSIIMYHTRYECLHYPQIQNISSKPHNPFNPAALICIRLKSINFCYTEVVLLIQTQVTHFVKSKVKYVHKFVKSLPYFL